MAPYVYRPLRTARNSTRLLQILPDVQGTDIHCLMFDYTLSQDRASGPYEALSYVWGDSTEPRQIFVRDARPTEPRPETPTHLDVTANLYAALQRLRDRFIPRLLWIDAVCINQELVEERAAQVLFMAKIYLCASRVVVWLGEESDDSSHALAGLEQAAMNVRRGDWRNDGPFTFVDDPTVTSRYKKVEYRGIPVQRSIEILLKRPWFHRVWVLQEVAAARQLSVVCGLAEITGASFVEGLTDLVRESNLLIDNTELSVLDMMAWEPPLSQSDHVSPSAGPLQLDVLPLGVLFEKFYPHEATDQRDKVFALLGLCHHVHASSTLPLPDYTKSWWTIVTELVRYSLGPLVAMTTGEHEEQIIITGHGWPIGKVTDISTDRISITCSHFSGPQNGDDNCETSIDREGRHREIQLNDILWQMDGAPFPCMVRHHYDHFLVVNLSIPASRFLLRWQWERLIMDDPDMWQSESNRSRRITLVWTMGSIPYQTRSFQLSRARVEINDVMHPGRDRRLLECARILDDVNDENGLKATIDNWHGTDDQWHFQLLTLAHSHWASYQWLKKFCETLRWIVYRLGSWQQGQNTTYKHLREYWKSEGYLAFDILEIDDLFKKQSKQMQPPAAHDLWNAPTKFSNGWDYGAQNHSKFLSLFFRQHSKPWPNSTHEQGTRCGRYVIHLMLPDPKLPNGPVHAPKTMLDAMIRAGYRIEHSVNLHLIVFGVISETRQNKLRLPKRILHSLVNCPRGADILSFLLAESYRDVRLIYKILQVAIERECRPHVIELVPRSDRYYERRAEHQRRPDHDFADRSGTPEALPSRHMLMASWLHENIRVLEAYMLMAPWLHENIRVLEAYMLMAPWLHENIRVLEAYIRHTDICKVAHSAKNDTVLLTLLAVFSYIDGTDYKHSQLSSETSREMILKGMSQFLEEHNVITMTLSRRHRPRERKGPRAPRGGFRSVRVGDDPSTR